MGLTRFPNGLSSFGVPVLPGLPMTTGSVYFVSSGSGSNGNKGTDIEQPFATIDYAIGRCAAGKGDVIVVLPGHAEAVSAAGSITLDVAGVQIVGLGEGASRPTITFGTANTATITVSAAGCSVTNIHHVANFLNVASAYTLAAAADFRVEACSFVDTSSILNFLCIVTTSATNNEADGLSFLNNYVYSLPATDGAVVSILGNALRVRVNGNIVDKAATNDAGHLITMSSKVTGGIQILDNILTVVGSAGAAVGILFTGSSTTSSGICARNYVNSLDTTGALIATTGTKISFQENYVSGAADASGTLWPVADNPA